MRTIILAAATAFSLLLPSAGFADEYNFTVPVRVENAVNVSGGRVLCQVTFVEGGSYANDQASGFFETVDGAYTGNVAVPVTTVRPRDSQTQWSCEVRLNYAGVGWFPTDPAAIPDWYRNRSGHTVQSLTLMTSGGRLP